MSGNQASELEREVSYTEVKNTFFSLHPNKSLGPDGFNAYFFKRAWHIICDDVVATVQSFFLSGHLLKEINNTYIALVPKVPNPSSINDYMPISYSTLCINALAKFWPTELRVCSLVSLTRPNQLPFQGIR